MKAEYVAPEVCRELIDYDHLTGRMTWKMREVKGRGDAIFNARYAGKSACNFSLDDGYLGGSIYGKKFRAHRVAWAIHYGKWPEGQIDHINGVRDDNRIENLRDIPAAENQRNMCISSRNKTGCTGVYWVARVGRWRVICANRHIGYFCNFDEAVRARASAAHNFGFHPNHGRVAA